MSFGSIRVSSPASYMATTGQHQQNDLCCAVRQVLPIGSVKKICFGAFFFVTVFLSMLHFRLQTNHNNMTNCQRFGIDSWSEFTGRFLVKIKTIIFSIEQFGKRQLRTEFW